MRQLKLTKLTSVEVYQNESKYIIGSVLSPLITFICYFQREVDIRSFRTPNHIPEQSIRHIEERHHPRTSKPTYFLPSLPTRTITRMILETAQKSETCHVDPRTSKKLYRYRRYDQVIGQHVISGQPCHWLVVVAKRNSWITAAYPVTDPSNVTSTKPS